MWVHDIETLRFVAVNDAALRLYGYGSEEFCQLTIPDLVPSELAPAVREQIAEIEAANPGISTHRRKDGTPIHIEISAREMPHAGRIARLVTALDVTARVQADAAARRLNAQLEQQLHERTTRFETAVSELESFSYSVSHDLRAPLRCIHGFARTLAEEHGAQLDAEGRRLLGVIRQETQHMGQLIDDILAFSRVGRQALDPSAINMTELAAGTFQDLMEALPDRALTLQSAALPPASGDRAMIRLVLTNLFANAIKFTGRQSAPKIEITGQEQDGQRLYCIRDNGVGFDPRYTHKLFNVFQRLHSQDEFEGTGVGLAIVQRIIHRHGGRVWAESELDRGAAFFFTLPATAAQPSP
jgi:PAS domain S-box-containing protein